MKPSDRIFVAIDRMSAADARADIARVAASGCGVKLGLEFFVANGPGVVRDVCPADTPLFLDLKLHDIPNTVAGATRGACAVQPQLLTIHASGGMAMMQAAVAAARETAGAAAPKLLAITVLTSLDEDDLAGVGQRGPIAEQVKRLADLAQRAGVGGVVSAPQEVAMLRQQCGPGFLLVTPGIRPSWAAAGDQKRITTPRDAIAMGADHLVIGRPVTQANDPAGALDRICAEIAAAA